ncbi:MAG: ribonuclease HII [Patescibacteria group bacterium]
MKNENEKIIGVDEAGRGPLAGPVFAAAAYVIKEDDFLKEVKDSKKISEKKRERIFDQIVDSPNILISVAKINPSIIDDINILEATKLAMKKAVAGVDKKGLVIIDGNFSIPIQRKQKSVIKADEKILECSLASIAAKVSRDRLMREFDREYPQYGFAGHKGYPTKAHKAAIKKHGLCPIHRKTFKSA